jgi:hypothetical protein
VLELYFGSLRIAETDPAQWSVVAPGVPLSAVAPLEAATVVGVPGPVTPSINVSGSTVTGVQVQTTVTLAGGERPGVYTITMTGAPVNGRLTVTGWRMGTA